MYNVCVCLIWRKTTDQLKTLVLESIWSMNDVKDRISSTSYLQTYLFMGKIWTHSIPYL